MARRIKYIASGKQQTQPIKSERKIEEVMYYLLSVIETEKKKGNQKRMRLAYRNWFLVLIGFNTAFRAEDLLQLRVKDLIDGYVHIRENKTGKMQNYQLSKALQEDIEEYVDRMGFTTYDYLFPSQRTDGRIRAITRQQADRILYKVKKECRIGSVFAMHSLRKTFGYQYYANGGKLLTLQRMYNHASPDETLLYIMWDSNDAESERKHIYYGGVHRKKNPKSRK